MMVIMWSLFMKKLGLLCQLRKQFPRRMISMGRKRSAMLGAPTGERWVDVDTSTNIVRLMVGGAEVARYEAQMSVGPLDDFHDTMPGSYEIGSKVAELTWTPYAKNYFMYWAGFDAGRENGFHSWTMDYKGRVVPGGDGPTWGCVATARAIRSRRSASTVPARARSPGGAGRTPERTSRSTSSCSRQASTAARVCDLLRSQPCRDAIRAAR